MSNTKTALLAVGVVAVAASVALVSGAGSVFAGEDPELASFDAHQPSCTDQQTLNSSAHVSDRNGETSVVHVANVSLPHPDHELDGSLERIGEDRYALNVTSEAGDGGAAQCLATARYVAEFTVPQESGYAIEVYHDGERVSPITENGTESSVGATDG